MPSRSEMNALRPDFSEIVLNGSALIGNSEWPVVDQRQEIDPGARQDRPGEVVDPVPTRLTHVDRVFQPVGNELVRTRADHVGPARTVGDVDVRFFAVAAVAALVARRRRVVRDQRASVVEVHRPDHARNVVRSVVRGPVVGESRGNAGETAKNNEQRSEAGLHVRIVGLPEWCHGVDNSLRQIKARTEEKTQRLVVDVFGRGLTESRSAPKTTRPQDSDRFLRGPEGLARRPAMRRRKASAKARAAWKVQGRYLGAVRQLSTANRAKVKAIREKKRLRAAITAARKLAKG